MYANKIVTEPTKLEEAIDRIMSKMAGIEPDTKEYAAMVDQLTKLYKLKETDVKLQLQEFDAISKREEVTSSSELKQAELTLKQEETEFRKKRVSPETLAIIGGNIAGIVLILGYEHVHVVTSKALGFVMRSSR